MTQVSDDRLLRLLGGEHLAALRRRLRRRFERAPLDGTVEHARIDGLGPEEHAALAALLGRPQRFTRSLQVDIGMVDDALRRAGIAASLREALEQLDGPITHLAAERLREESRWSDVIGDCTRPDLTSFLQTPEGAGLLKRLARQDPAAARALCYSAEAVLRRLPANGVTRSQLAADVMGDAHALDNGQPVATLVLAVRRRLAPSAGEDEERLAEQTPDDGQSQLGNAERARDTWAKAGILVNQLARPALFLNLPVRGAYGASRYGEPAYLSLRSLLRSPPAWDVAGRAVFVCENPNLLAIAADRWAGDCAPFVCTEGMPGAAQRTLLSQLAQGQARLCYHGDFDWPGLRIANHVMREYGAAPWRFGATDYLAAVRTATGLPQRLQGRAGTASWDDALASAMHEHDIAIAEEAVATELLVDLEDR